MITWFLGRRLYQIFQNDFAWRGRDTSRPRQMIDIQYNTTIMGRPTGFGFSPKASGFYPFGDATALAGEGGDIAKRLFFMFLFQPPQYFSTEPNFNRRFFLNFVG